MKFKMCRSTCKDDVVVAVHSGADNKTGILDRVELASDTSSNTTSAYSSRNASSSRNQLNLQGKSSALRRASSIKRASLINNRSIQDEDEDDDDANEKRGHPDHAGDGTIFALINEDKSVTRRSSINNIIRSSLTKKIMSKDMDFIGNSMHMSLDSNKDQTNHKSNITNYSSSRDKSTTYGDLLARSTEVLEEMKKSWAVTGLSSLNLQANSSLSRSRLKSPPDAVLVSQSWNKVLAFQSMFAEALVGRWRFLAAMEEARENEISNTKSSAYSKSFSFQSPVSRLFQKQLGISAKTRAIHMVESNKDPIARCFETRTADLEIFAVGAIDAAVRELCPHSQVLHREAYRALNGSIDPDPSVSQAFFHDDECTTFEDFCFLFAGYGVQPQYWITFCKAFLWTMAEHNPYILDDERDDLNEPSGESAHARFIAGMVALPMVEATIRRASYTKRNIFRELRLCCSFDRMESDFDQMGMHMFTKLFEEFPEIADHFSQSDVHEMSFEIFQMLNAIIKDSDCEMSNPESNLRTLLREQGAKWTELGLSTHTYFIIGKGILEECEVFFDESHESVDRLRNALAFLWKEAMQYVLHPVLFHQNLILEASRFYDDVAKELKWSPQILEKRMFEINMEISATGQYTHTQEELEIGARLAWRNSAKCIGRIAWNTLVVRDRRHCSLPNEIFHEVSEHLKLATDGTNIQSVMTVFRPQYYNEVWGIRFWSSQFVRYAGYKDKHSGEVLGDPANVGFTSYLIKKGLWIPPAALSAFDVLPLVLKLPGNDIPFIYELPKAVTHEVNLEHPNFPQVKDLGYKWAAVPAISNFKMKLGGITYAAAPFNGWFVSIEVARNLLERYEATAPLATAMGMDLGDRFLAQKVSAELESAILHSFEKNEFTMVDPMTVGKSFMTHCKREKSAGRECPAQWSWIGGLVGPTNPTWHLEMRDFKKTPQYDYCCDPWRVFDVDESDGHNETVGVDHIVVSTDGDGGSTISLPKVLIAYGSETGTAEAIATSILRRFNICRPTLMTLNDASQHSLQLDQYSYVLLICSTFGAGEPPLNAKDFFGKDLNGKINDTKFAVLALGSSLYPDFCKAGKVLHSKMIDAGAKSIVNLTCIDSAHGQQSEIQNWSTLVKKIVLPDSLLVQLQSSGIPMEDRNATISYAIKWHKDENCDGTHLMEHHGTMTCVENRELFERNESSRSTRHIVLKVPESTAYETGDHLSITPINSMNMVSRFCMCFSHELEISAVQSGYYRLKQETSQRQYLKESSGRMNITPSLLWQIEQPFYIESIENGRNSLHKNNDLTNKTLTEVLMLYLDFSLGVDSQFVDFLQLLYAKLEEAEVNNRAATSFKGMAKTALHYYYELDDSTKIENIRTSCPTIVHFLEKFGELFCVPLQKKEQPKLNLAEVLVMMGRLRPRQYSISSSGTLHSNEVSITVGVLNYRTLAGVRGKGVCSNYLAGLKPGEMVNARMVQSSFRPPKSLKHHMILICAGTGLAPFMGFVEDRASLMEKTASTSRLNIFGESHLFFGCRSENEMLYRNQLLKWEENGVIKLHLAQSRQRGESKNYVHDSLEAYGKQFVDLLMFESEAHVYICGHVGMANNCKNTCIALLHKYGGMSKISATRFLANMRINNRWQLDVWGMSDEDNIDLSYHRNVTSRVIDESRRTLVRDFSRHGSLSAL